jgi:hypothetical protein
VRNGFPSIWRIRRNVIRITRRITGIVQSTRRTTSLVIAFLLAKRDSAETDSRRSIPAFGGASP